MSNESWSHWEGKSEVYQDPLSVSLTQRIAATFGERSPAAGDPLPPLWHWAFFQEPVSAEHLGEDGHPARGRFLPPVDGRNRMWAGGRLDFKRPLRVGVDATRHSTITAIEEKQGKTGALLFVTVRHEYIQDNQLCLREEQDIVYREPSPPKLESAMPLPMLEWSETHCPSSVMLFRYSAVTFNGHRIHYDYPYATEQEGYPGLVVHGPLIATLLVHSFLQNNPDLIPSRFAFRGLRPLIAGGEFQVGGHRREGNKYALWAFDSRGPAQQAEIEYKENT